MKSPRKFILSHHRAPGDLVCLTSLVRDIHLTYPGEFLIDVNTTVTPIWDNNPYLTKLWNHDGKNPKIFDPDTKMISCQYGQGIKDQKKETIHFAAYFHRDFEKQTGIKVPVQLPHGDLHLSDYEKATSPVKGRYWLIMTGGKSDFTIKVWHKNYFQEVSDRLGEMGLGVVQSGATHAGHWHPQLKGDHVIDLVGWGGFREWMQQIYHAEGVICGVTGAMHMAAAMHKPCVVIAGGREAWWWEAYVNENKGFGPIASGKHPMPHKFLHTIGLLDCCMQHGCWKNKVVPMGSDKLICKLPVTTPEMPIAKCMQMITPDHVVNAVAQYYEDRSLPPIDPNLRISRAPDILAPVTTTEQPAEQPAAEACSSPKCETGGTCKSGKCTPQVKTNIPKGSIVLPAGVPLVINPRAKVNMLDPDARKRVPEAPGATQAFNDVTVIDHPDVGGKYTVCMLFYGGEEHHEMHKRCLNSFLATVPHDRIDLRVGSNALNQKSLDMIEEYVQKGFITKHYRHDTNDFKYPVMREMFFDKDHPITTKWVIWFDDDSICDVNPQWLNILSIHISQNHRSVNAHMIGAKYTWTLNDKQKQVFSSRPWYRGKPWRANDGNPSPNGNKVIFATGGFWAITHEAIVGADIPDLGTGLTHTGGDWQIGEQLYQAGYGLKQFNGKKQFVRTSSVARRGVTHPTVDQIDDSQRRLAASTVVNAPAISPNVNVITPPRKTESPHAAKVTAPVPKQPKPRKKRKLVELQ